MSATSSERAIPIMRRFQQYLRAFLIGLAFLVGLWAITILVPAVGLLSPQIMDRVRGRVAVYWYRSLARILNLRIRRIGQVMEMPGLVVGNHVSWLDIVVLGAQAPFDFIAKQEVAEWPVVGYLGRRAGTLFLRRGDPESTHEAAEEMVWRLRRGRRLMLFPEGTSSSGEEVLKFHARLFQPALLAQVPVQAVAIRYGGEARNLAPFIGDDDFLPHLWRLMALRTIEVDLVFCPRLDPGKFNRSTLAQHTRSQIEAVLIPRNQSRRRIA